MQIFTTRYNLEFRKLALYGISRTQSIRKSKQISGQTILSSPHNLELNPNFARNRDIPVGKNSVIYAWPVMPAVRILFNIVCNVDHMSNSRGGGGTPPIFGYRWAAEGLKPWPCLGQHPQFYYPIVKHPVYN